MTSFIACFRLSQDLSYYKSIIPEEENINASLWHYEILQEKISNDYEAKAYFSVLSNINFYLDLYAINHENDTGWLDIYLGHVLRKMIDKVEFREYYGKLKYEYRLFYGLKVKEQSRTIRRDDGTLQRMPPIYEYDDRHFNLVISNQKNYQNEKIAIFDLKLPRLKVVKSYGDVKKNLRSLNWYARRYPDVDFYHDLMVNQIYFPAHRFILRGRDRVAYDNLVELLGCYRHQRDYDVHKAREGGVIKKAFVNNYFVILRNRMNQISSRNLAKIEMWVPVEVLATNLSGEVATEKWTWVRLLDNVTGYVLSDAIVRVSATKNQQDIANQYWQAADFLYQKKFLQAFTMASFMIEHREDIWQERASVLLNEILKEIAKRATSKNNPYTDFVYRYKHYFSLHVNKTDVVPSDLVLKKLLSLNKASAFMPYFDNL